MRRLKDIAGQKFGNWTALQFVRNGCRNVFWRCRCDCGSIKLRDYHALTTGNAIDCDCAAVPAVRSWTKRGRVKWQ